MIFATLEVSKSALQIFFLKEFQINSPASNLFAWGYFMLFHPYEMVVIWQYNWHCMMGLDSMHICAFSGAMKTCGNKTCTTASLIATIGIFPTFIHKTTFLYWKSHHASTRNNGTDRILIGQFNWTKQAFQKNSKLSVDANPPLGG